MLKFSQLILISSRSSRPMWYLSTCDSIAAGKARTEGVLVVPVMRYWLLEVVLCMRERSCAYR